MGIKDFKKGYQFRTRTVKSENGDLVKDNNIILVRWKKHFSQLLNVHTAEPLVPEPSVLEFEMAIEKIKKNTIYQID